MEVRSGKGISEDAGQICRQRIPQGQGAQERHRTRLRQRGFLRRRTQYPLLRELSHRPRREERGDRSGGRSRAFRRRAYGRQSGLGRGDPRPSRREDRVLQRYENPRVCVYCKGYGHRRRNRAPARAQRPQDRSDRPPPPKAATSPTSTLSARWTASNSTAAKRKNST